MSWHVLEYHGVRLFEIVKMLHQLRVRHGLVTTFLPARLLPLRRPLVHRLDHVLRVRSDSKLLSLSLFAVIECFDGRAACQEFHSLIGDAAVVWWHAATDVSWVTLVKIHADTSYGFVLPCLRSSVRTPFVAIGVLRPLAPIPSRNDR